MSKMKDKMIDQMNERTNELLTGLAVIASHIQQTDTDFVYGDLIVPKADVLKYIDVLMNIKPYKQPPPTLIYHQTIDMYGDQLIELGLNDKTIGFLTDADATAMEALGIDCTNELKCIDYAIPEGFILECTQD